MVEVTSGGIVVAQIHGESGALKALKQALSAAGREFSSLAAIRRFQRSWKKELHVDTSVERTRLRGQIQRFEEKITRKERQLARVIRVRDQQERNHRRFRDFVKNRPSRRSRGRTLLWNLLFIPILRFQWDLRNSSLQAKRRLNCSLSKEIKQLRQQATILRKEMSETAEREKKAHNARLEYIAKCVKTHEKEYIGAIGEMDVIRALARLPAGYVVINDVQLTFSPALYWPARDDYILSAQIDHVVVGLTGVHVLETKNWGTKMHLKQLDFPPEVQVARASFALKEALKDQFPVRKGVPCHAWVVWANKMPPTARQDPVYVPVDEICSRILQAAGPLDPRHVLGIAGVLRAHVG